MRTGRKGKKGRIKKNERKIKKNSTVN